MVNFDDSSSEDSMNDEKVMPVFSQIMEVKLEGKKLCDKIKMLEKTFKLEKSTNLKMKEKI